MSDLFGRCYPRRLCLGQRECCLMLVAYGEPAWLIKQPLCQFAPRHTLGSSIRARAQMKVGSLTFHAEQKSHVNDLHMRRRAHQFASQHANGATLHRQIDFDTFAKAHPDTLDIDVCRSKRRRVRIPNPRCDMSRHGRCRNRSGLLHWQYVSRLQGLMEKLRGTGHWFFNQSFDLTRASGQLRPGFPSGPVKRTNQDASETDCR
jgi:hypothetical protein